MSVLNHNLLKTKSFYGTKEQREFTSPMSWVSRCHPQTFRGSCLQLWSSSWWFFFLPVFGLVRELESGWHGAKKKNQVKLFSVSGFYWCQTLFWLCEVKINVIRTAGLSLFLHLNSSYRTRSEMDAAGGGTRRWSLYWLAGSYCKKIKTHWISKTFGFLIIYRVCPVNSNQVSSCIKKNA